MGGYGDRPRTLVFGRGSGVLVPVEEYPGGWCATLGEVHPYGLAILIAAVGVASRFAAAIVLSGAKVFVGADAHVMPVSCAGLAESDVACG